MEHVKQKYRSCLNNINSRSKVRALDRFKYTLEGERSEPKIFVTIFPHYNKLNKHFFLLFHEQTIYFSQVAEQTIYFSLFAEQSFLTQKTHSPPPCRNQTVGPNLITHYFDMKTGRFKSHQYTFHDVIIYLTHFFLVCTQIKFNSQLVFLFWLLNRKRDIPEPKKKMKAGITSNLLEQGQGSLGSFFYQI